MRCWIAFCLLLDPEVVLATEYATWKQGERLLPHVRSCLDRVKGGEESLVLASLAYKTAQYFREHGQYAEAEPLYQRALRIRELVLGPDHPGVASSLNFLAVLYWQQGKYTEAEPLYQRALHIREQALGLDHLEVATTLHYLAILYAEQGKYEQTEPLNQRASRIAEQTLGSQHRRSLSAPRSGGLLRQKQGNQGEAISLAERALKIRSQSLGDAHPKTVATRTLAAQLFQEQVCAQEEATSQRSTKGLSGACREDLHTERAAFSVHEAVAPSSSENDPLQGFLDACCELNPRAWCRSADLWQAYERWVEEYQDRFPLSRGAFIAQLQAHGYHADRTKSARIWRGIALVKTNDDGG